VHGEMSAPLARIIFYIFLLTPENGGQPGACPECRDALKQSRTIFLHNPKHFD